MTAERKSIRRVQDGLLQLRDALLPFVEARMKVVHASNRPHYASRASGSPPNTPLDAHLPKLRDRVVLEASIRNSGILAGIFPIMPAREAAD